MDWIPRSLNMRADFLSRITNYDDWAVDPCIFHELDASWGPHSVDCFATTLLSYHVFIVGFGHLAARQWIHSLLIGVMSSTGGYPHCI